MERDCRMGWGDAREGEDVEERIGYSFQPSNGSEKGNSSFRAVRVRWDSWDDLGTHILLRTRFFPKCVPNVSRNNNMIITR